MCISSPLVTQLVNEIEQAPPQQVPNLQADVELAALLAWRERSLQVYDDVPALSPQESISRQRGLNVVLRIIESIEAQCCVRWPDSFLEVVRLVDFLAQIQGPAASASVVLTRGLAALDVVLQRRQVDFSVNGFVKDDIEGESILANSAALQERLYEALADHESLPNLVVWLNTIWDRFDAITGQSFAEFVPKLREVSCHLATLSMRLTAPYKNRAPHQIVLGSFALTLLISGIFAPVVLKPSSMDLREWKKALINIFCANVDVGYEAAPLPPQNCMLFLILCTGSTMQQLQECTMCSMQAFADVSSCGSNPTLKAQLSDWSESSIAVGDQKASMIVEGLQ
jgi:hypothetical protein